MMQKPDVDHITGLSPAISIEQKTTSKNPRSTVGTVTEIYDYLRLLFARVGTPYSPGHRAADRGAADQPDGRHHHGAARGHPRLPAGADRARPQGRVPQGIPGPAEEGLPAGQGQRRVPRPRQPAGARQEVPPQHRRGGRPHRRARGAGDPARRLACAPRSTSPTASPSWRPRRPRARSRSASPSRENFACPVSGFTIPEIEPRLFSFNAPYGACPACDGLGVELFFDPRLVVPDESLPLLRGAIAPWAAASRPGTGRPSRRWPATTASTRPSAGATCRSRRSRCCSTAPEGEKIRFRYDEGGRVYEISRPFEGVLPNLERRYRETDSAWSREEMERFQNNRPCGTCHGFRLKPEALAVKIGGLHVGEVVRMSIREALAWVETVPAALTAQRNEIARAILKEIRERLGFLVNVGLDYLTLARNAGTLSGGESQRIRLASQIGSGLTGVLYVLDEPSIGLHQRDNGRLLTTLKNLRDAGNTVIVVEHDEEAIREADHVIDIGPGAGVHGGEIIAEGTPADIAAAPASITGQYLTGAARDPDPRRAAQGQRQEGQGGERHRQQPARRHRELPARHLHLRHRRLRRRQVDADHRDPVQDRLDAAERRPPDPGALRGGRGARASRQGHRHRPVADRPHPALEPRHLHRRLRPDPRLVRRPAREQGARLQARPLLLQRQGRPLRGLPGRRRHQDRDALPARRLRHLRDLQGQALQPRDAGGAVQGQVASPTSST